MQIERADLDAERAAVLVGKDREAARHVDVRYGAVGVRDRRVVDGLSRAFAAALATTRAQIGDPAVRVLLRLGQVLNAGVDHGDALARPELGRDQQAAVAAPAQPRLLRHQRIQRDAVQRVAGLRREAARAQIRHQRLRDAPQLVVGLHDHLERCGAGGGRHQVSIHLHDEHNHVPEKHRLALENCFARQACVADGADAERAGTLLKGAQFIDAHAPAREGRIVVDGCEGVDNVALNTGQVAPHTAEPGAARAAGGHAHEIAGDVEPFGCIGPGADAVLALRERGFQRAIGHFLGRPRQEALQKRSDPGEHGCGSWSIRIWRGS